MENSINCRGHLLSLKEVSVMGILNVTEDFFDGGVITARKNIP